MRSRTPSFRTFVFYVIFAGILVYGALEILELVNGLQDIVRRST